MYEDDKAIIFLILLKYLFQYSENLYPTFLPLIKNLKQQTINQEHKMLQSQHDDL